MLKMFKKRKFAEDEVVEETAVTEESTEESTPDSGEQFINLLVDMGLSAEQAEAVHTMAMELAGTSEGEQITEEVKEEVKVEASRQARTRRPRREMQSREEMGSRRSRRSEMSREDRPNRRQLSAEERTEMMLKRQSRQISELRGQLRELGAQPASRGISNAPRAAQKGASDIPVPSKGGDIKSRVFEMMKNVK